MTPTRLDCRLALSDLEHRDGNVVGGFEGKAAVEREVLHMDEHTAKQYWVMFNQCLVNQLTQIVLQLIHGIKAGQF